MPLFLRRQIIRAGLKSGADRLQAIFKDNAIKYANFFKKLPDSDIMLLIQRMDEFEKNYPESNLLQTKMNATFLKQEK